MHNRGWTAGGGEPTAKGMVTLNNRALQGRQMHDRGWTAGGGEPTARDRITNDTPALKRQKIYNFE
jgi:hypothetical protein